LELGTSSQLFQLMFQLKVGF